MDSEDTIEIDIPKQTSILVPVVSSLISLAVGAGVGYILGKRNRKFIHAVPPQDWNMSDLTIVDEAVNVPAQVLSELEEPIERGAVFIENHLREVEPEKVNVFSNGSKVVTDTWDYEAELESRTDTEPYVLHKDEFYSEESGYSQQTLTYYAGDDILVDQESAPIYNYTSILGELKFGHGSDDADTFYVRNDKLKAEFEVCRDGGLYAVEVLGHEMEENARVENLTRSRERKSREE